MNKIAAVVILFNPDNSVLRNIDSIYNQVDKIYAVDNSIFINNEFQNEIKKKEKVEYIPLGENKGIGYVLNYVIKKVENNYEFLLTMDQDSYADSEMINNLLQAFNFYPNAVVSAPIYFHKYDKNIKNIQKFNEVLFEKTSGNLINLKLINKVGLFNEELFIDYIDIEFCLRVNLSGYKVIQVSDAFLHHNEGNLSSKKFLNKIVFPYNHQPIRYYYKIRNYFYLKELYSLNYPNFFKDEFINYLKQLLKVLFYEESKFEKFKMTIRGFLDFKKGIKGIYKDEKQRVTNAG